MPYFTEHSKSLVDYAVGVRCCNFPTARRDAGRFLAGAVHLQLLPKGCRSSIGRAHTCSCTTAARRRETHSLRYLGRTQTR